MSAPEVRQEATQECRKTDQKSVLEIITAHPSSCEWLKILMRQNSVVGTHGEVREQVGLSWNGANEKDESSVRGKARRKLS